MAGLVPAMLLFAPRIRLTWAHLIGGAFLLWAFVSYSWAEARYEWFDVAWKFALLAGAFCLGSTLENLKPVYLGAGAGLLLSTIAVGIQEYGAWHFPNVYPISGLFINKNILAEIAALVLVALLAEKRWLLFFAVMPCLILTEARGAALGFMIGAAGVLFEKQYRQWGVVVLLFGLMVTAVAILQRTPDVLVQEPRIAMALDAWNAMTLFGHGLGSYYAEMPAYAQHYGMVFSRNLYAHNDLIEIAFELGLPGLVLAVAFCISCLYGPLNTERLVFASFLVIGLFGFPLFMPATGFIGLLVAGHAARGLSRIRIPALDGGTLLRRVVLR